MLCCGVLCCAVLCRAVLCDVMQALEVALLDPSAGESVSAGITANHMEEAGEQLLEAALARPRRTCAFIAAALSLCLAASVHVGSVATAYLSRKAADHQVVVTALHVSSCVCAHQMCLILYPHAYVQKETRPRCPPRTHVQSCCWMCSWAH
jgi:hypothetical protein